MTSGIDVNANENNANDKANKRSFFALIGKAAKGVVFLFFLLGLTATPKDEIDKNTRKPAKTGTSTAKDAR